LQKKAGTALLLPKGKKGGGRYIRPYSSFQATNPKPAKYYQPLWKLKEQLLRTGIKEETIAIKKNGRNSTI